MHLSCSSLLFSKEQFPDMSDVIREISQLGFRALDLGAIEGWQNVDPSLLVDDGG